MPTKNLRSLQDEIAYQFPVATGVNDCLIFLSQNVKSISSKESGETTKQWTMVGLGDMGVPGHLPKCQLLKNLGLRNYFFMNGHFKAGTTLQNIHSSDNQNENKIKTQVETCFTTNLGR
jgi:hypothetical protein